MTYAPLLLWFWCIAPLWYSKANWNCATETLLSLFFSGKGHLEHGFSGDNQKNHYNNTNTNFALTWQVSYPVDWTIHYINDKQRQ